MAARPPSPEPSLLSRDSSSRRSSLASNPDIFSDDYALEPIDSNLLMSFDNSDHSEQTSTHETSNVIPYPAIPQRLSTLERPSSTAKSHSQSQNNATSEARSRRTLSTSSQASTVRAPSPYNGPTQPSHPYAMYPQVTRASSVASSSTIRPQEQPFVSTRGPEHPYAMYTQNPLPEEGDDIGTQPIPLGFDMNFGPSRGASRGDSGDIVGADGHVEQLPPYTRYADNVVAKGDMADLNEPRVTEMTASSSSERTSERSSLVVPVSSTNAEEAPADEAEEGTAPLLEGRTVRWKTKAQRRVCGGIALWLVIIVVTLVVLAGVLGGVIGGVVGRRQGTTEATDSPKPATTTIWLDADPAVTDSDTPSCPTGKYTIPLNQTQEISQCIGPGPLRSSWGCLDIAYLGITVARDGPHGNLTVQFDDYSVNTAQFRYGPQPPDFNGTTFPLEPHMDKDNKDLGVALFFWEKFDKLTILPSKALSPDMARSVDSREVHQRAAWYDGMPLQIGETPWYCFWNGTINEFWIFLEEPSVAASTSASSVTAAPTTPTSSYTSSFTTKLRHRAPEALPTYAVHHNDPRGKSSPASAKMVRRGYTAPYYPEYPKLIKMIEKRQLIGNTQPYCQRMQVLADWRIVPDEENEIIFIKEAEYGVHPIDAEGSKGDMIEQVGSNCVCEWMSI